MLTEDERKQIVVALEAWARSIPDKPLIGFLSNGRIMTPLELVKEVYEGTADGKAVIEILEHGARREGIDRVVARLSGETEVRRG